MAADVQSEDRFGGGVGGVGGLGDADAPGLAAPADLDLRLDDDRAAYPFGGLPGFRGRGSDGALEDGHSVLLEDVTGLVLEEVHAPSL